MKFQENLGPIMVRLQKEFSKSDKGKVKENAFLCIDLGYITLVDRPSLDLEKLSDVLSEKPSHRTVVFSDPSVALKFICHPICEKKWVCIQFTGFSHTAITTNEQGIKHLTAPLKSLNVLCLGAWLVNFLSGDVLQIGSMPNTSASTVVPPPSERIRRVVM